MRSTSTDGLNFGDGEWIPGDGATGYDPKAMLLPNSTIRMYTTALIEESPGRTKVAIVSATGAVQ